MVQPSAVGDGCVKFEGVVTNSDIASDLNWSPLGSFYFVVRGESICRAWTGLCSGRLVCSRRRSPLYGQLARTGQKHVQCRFRLLL